MQEEPKFSPVYDWKVVEPKVRKFTKEVDFIKDSLKGDSERSASVGYVEGPPTLNGVPHIGHIRGRIMKDLWYRYSTLLLKENVVFRAGWDCQGLPVELQAEKELGLSGNKWEDLKQIGEEKLVEACKRLLGKYLQSWEEADDLLGLLLDHSKAYMTYRDGYIEREWKFLERAWERGILGEGFKVVPYCPSCMTSLEPRRGRPGLRDARGPEPLLQGESLGRELPGRSGPRCRSRSSPTRWSGVKPDANYAYVKVGGETWVVGEDRKAALAKELDLEFGETVKVGQGQGPRRPHLRAPPPQADTRAREAPRAREDPQGRRRGVRRHRRRGPGSSTSRPPTARRTSRSRPGGSVPVFAPIDDRVRFTEDAGRFAGLFVRDADSVVSKLLTESGNLVNEGTLEHEYPTCWRSGHRLVWVARREYFYWIDRVKDKLVEAAEKVEYYFDQPRNRFIEFLKQSPPWCISRERVWGTPLPIWVCAECKEKVPAFSRREHRREGEGSSQTGRSSSSTGRG